MKKILYILTITLSLSSLLMSCADFLDNEPENIGSMEEVFEQRENSLKYLSNVYSYINNPYYWSNGSIFTGVSDEVDISYADYNVSKINLGNLAPDKDAQSYGSMWSRYYRGIRAATNFIDNIDKNKEMTQDEILQYKEEARALRAWFYFHLVRQYGPVVILKEQIPADAPNSALLYPRSSISECFRYITTELDACINSRALPEVYPTKGQDYGRMTAAVCKALKARTLLYASSDLFINDRTLPLFKTFKNNDGSLMIDYTDIQRDSLLLEAKLATEAVLNISEFSLYKEYKSDGSIDPYASYRNVFQNDWNSEIIFEIIATKDAPNECGLWEMDRSCRPVGLTAGWGGWGTTQETVDAFFTKTGHPLLPKGDGTYYAKDNSYTETGFSGAAGDDGYTQVGTFNMYCNREPRFYVSILFEGAKYFNEGVYQPYYGGSSGVNVDGRNYSTTGYLPYKLVSSKSTFTSGNNYYKRGVMLMRLAEFYLNYCEILNEISYENHKSTILEYLNRIRERAGIPGYGGNINGVPGPNIPETQAEMREAIRRERRVELVFEEHRYFDACRWAIAHKDFGGPKHGMAVNDTRGKSHFFERTVFETRTYGDNNLLWPIPQNEIWKDKELVQNPGWRSVSTVE